ncbi:MAG: DUF3866 family protein [Actinomycetota bacterium]|nr:DUF3866 family protein [Actinomycetota bacterium]
MLTLRRGIVAAAGDPSRPMQELEVQVGDERRPALVDVSFTGPAHVGDDVVVNVAALDLALGSGGYDLVHVNLSRGLGGAGVAGAHVMKLNYTSLQHAVAPAEERTPTERGNAAPASDRLRGGPVAVCFLHGQLAPLAWAFGQVAVGARLGFVQTAGGALTGALSRVVPELRERHLLAGHITAGPCYGGEHEAITTAGAIEHGFLAQGWDAAVCGPGPGILGSGTRLGHGGMIALETSHTAAALGCHVVVTPRRSSGDPRPRHQGLSHHTQTMLELALVALTVATHGPVEEGLERHHWRSGRADLGAYVASGLPARHMGRSWEQDPEFFASALAAGDVLASLTACR